MVTLHSMEPRSPEWDQTRATRIGSSQASAVMAKPRNGSNAEAVTRRDLRIQLALSRLGGHTRKSDFSTAAMSYGVETEAQARAVYEMTTGLMVETPGYITNDELPGLGYSPDGCIEEVGLLEIKCPKDFTHWQTLSIAEENKGSQVSSQLMMVPKAYKFQLLHGLLVSSRHWIEFASYAVSFPLPLQLYVTRVHREDVREELDAYQAAVTEFLDEVKDTMTQITSLSGGDQ